MFFAGSTYKKHASPEFQNRFEWFLDFPPDQQNLEQGINRSEHFQLYFTTIDVLRFFDAQILVPNP